MAGARGLRNGGGGVALVQALAQVYVDICDERYATFNQVTHCFVPFSSGLEDVRLLLASKSTLPLSRSHVCCIVADGTVQFLFQYIPTTFDEDIRIRTSKTLYMQFVCSCTLLCDLCCDCSHGCANKTFET